MRIRYDVRAGRKSLAAIGLLCAIGVGRAQTGDAPVILSGRRPLYDAARRLERQYARPVTVEGPLIVWRGEMEMVRRGGLVASVHALVLPGSDGIFSAPALTAGVVKKVLDEYHSQNPGRSHYKVLESAIGFHIVPTDAHDEGGVLRPAGSVLDTRVEVLADARTFTEHVTALLDAVSKATGVQFTPFPNDNARYAANGYFLPQPMLENSRDRPYLEFKWGASGVTAREALIELLAGSATTMTWELRCGPGEGGNVSQQGCNLNTEPMSPAGRPVYLDHCTKCKPIPSQAGKTVDQILADYNSGH